jgi:hypothetical protein
VLSQARHWDEVTGGVVLARLGTSPDFSFFSPKEQGIAGALFDLLLGQHEGPKVPVLSMVDRRLALDETDGWMYADMPEDKIAWRLTLEALDGDAVDLFAASFPELSQDSQIYLVQRVQDAERWHEWEAAHVWSLWTRYACAAFYSHPWAWNEIGFGGPAYPRGYQALGIDKREHWEVADTTNRDPVAWGDRVERSRREQPGSASEAKE